MPDFARRLATELGLPFHAVILKTDDRPEQKSMANSVQQSRNVDGSLDIGDAPIPRGPVLLIDDMVDSRWTLTVAAWLLRTHGSVANGAITGAGVATPEGVLFASVRIVLQRLLSASASQ